MNKTLLGFVLGVLLGGSIVFFFWPAGHKKMLDNRLLLLQKQFDLQTATLDSIKALQLTGVLGNLLNLIDDDLKDDTRHALKKETIERIVGACYVFKPYLFVRGDSAIPRKLSPERGQLLLLLAKMEMDSLSMHAILQQASFAHADLQKADLQDANLPGVDLQGADLTHADLQGVNLVAANLQTANLWGANLNKAQLAETNLKRSDLRWTNLNEADLQKADLSGANLSSAQIRNSALQGSHLQWSDGRGAFFLDTDLDSANLEGMVLIAAQFHGANLHRANLTLANLKEANFQEANLTGAELARSTVSQENWFELLNQWQVEGAASIQHAYTPVYESGHSTPLYRIVKKK